MKHRLPFALSLLLGTLAFAPAPLPRRDRGDRPDEITLDTFQGRWRVVQMQISRGGRYEPFQASYTHVRISDRNWTFFNDQKAGVTTFIAIDDTKRPAQLNFYDDY